MNTSRWSLLIAAALLFAGCATQTKEQLAAVRAAHVSPGLLQKLEHRGFLTPDDLIELHRKRVDDGVAIRQLNRVGVNYVLNKDDVKRLKAARVSQTVIDAAIMASNRYVVLYYFPYADYPYGWYPYYSPFAYTLIPNPPLLYPPRIPGGPMGGPVGGPAIGGPGFGGPRPGPRR